MERSLNPDTDYKIIKDGITLHKKAIIGGMTWGSVLYHSGKVLQIDLRIFKDAILCSFAF